MIQLDNLEFELMDLVNLFVVVTCTELTIDKTVCDYSPDI